MLLDFFQAKRLRVERLREAQAGPSAASTRAAIDFGDGDLGDGRGMDDEDEEVGAVPAHD
jgi:hypothetical protein